MDNYRAYIMANYGNKYGGEVGRAISGQDRSSTYDLREIMYAHGDNEGAQMLEFIWANSPHISQPSPPPKQPPHYDSIAKTGVSPGERAVLLEDAPLRFDESFYKQGHKGDEFTVVQYPPGKHRVYFITKDNNGNQIGLNVSDASVCLKPLTAQESQNCRNYLQQARDAFSMGELDDAIASAKKADECLPPTKNTIKVRTQRIISSLEQHKKILNTDPSQYRFGVDGVLKSSKEMLDSDFEETLKQLSEP